MIQNNAFTLEVDADGIGLVTLDMPDRAMNVLNPVLLEPFARLVDQLETDATLKGLVLTSGKPTFVVGADIDQLAQICTAEEAFALCEDLKRLLRRMEICGKPVVAALNGTALGGGLELALACHARIALDDPKLKLGLPEVKLGLLPGGGGTQRVLRLVGIQKAMDLITQGKELGPRKRWRWASSRRWPPPVTICSPRPGPGVAPTPSPRSRGTPRASASPVATARARRWCRCWPLRPRWRMPRRTATIRRSPTS